MPKAIIYCRVSSDRQVKEGHGLDGQEQRCRKFAQERGYAVAAVFRDEGVSGGVIDREGMQDLLDFLDKEGRREEHVVIIDDIKRLARDIMGHFTLRKAIQSRGAKLESPSHKFGNEPEEIFVESIMAATAELERNQNRRQVRNRMQARLEAGYWPFYPPPGYTYATVPGHGKLIVPKDPEAGIIRGALEGFASGRFPTQSHVQAFLQERGFNHWGRGKTAYLEQVKRLLMREVYAGFIHYPPWNVTRRKGHHEPLVSPETFDLIQERLAQKQKLPARKDLHNDFPLRGFVLCDGCQKPYTASWSKGKAKSFGYYRCTTLHCPYQHKSVRADEMHLRFEDLLRRLQPRESIMQGVKAEFLAEWKRRKLDVESVRREREKKLQEVQKEIDGTLQVIDKCSSPTVIKRLEEKVEELDARKLRLGGPVGRPKKGEYDFELALDRVFDFIKNPLLMWKIGNLQERRLVLRLVFSEALVYGRQTGFGTPTFSPPINVACVLELDKLELVEMVRSNWNTFYESVKEWAALLGERNTLAA